MADGSRAWARVLGATTEAEMLPTPSGCDCSADAEEHDTAFDLWIQHRRKYHATGDVIVVRCADDMVAGFDKRADTRRFLQEWKERLQKFGLQLTSDKTRLIEFGRHAAENRKQRGGGKPEVFNFLGFTEDRPVHRYAKDDPEAILSAEAI
jgi:hypothetical protein